MLMFLRIKSRINLSQIARNEKKNERTNQRIKGEAPKQGRLQRMNAQYGKRNETDEGR
jgi:hypothetical protein